MPVTTKLPVATVLQRYAAGATAAQLGQQFNCSKPTILKCLHRNAADVRRACIKPLARIEQNRTDILARYAAGSSMNEIAVKHGCSEWVIKDRLHDWHAPVRRTGPKRIHACDEHFFADIDTEEKAYWLGFLFADGSVGQYGAGNYHVRIELASVDRAHLLKFAEAIRLRDIVHEGHAGKSVYVNVCSVAMYRNLCALGCISRKTYGCCTPKLHPDLYRHFYRGLVDGDGSLYLDSGSWCFAAVGSPSFIADFQQWLMRHAKLRKTKQQQYGSVAAIRYGGNRQLKRIARLLYQDAAVYLDRKYAQACTILKLRTAFQYVVNK